MKYNFNGQKVMTRGIAQTIPDKLRLLILLCLDDMKTKTNNNLDYLQIFTITSYKKDDEYLVNIQHKQEVPAHCINHTYKLTLNEPVNCKVYIIDDIDHVTMLLAEEY